MRHLVTLCLLLAAVAAARLARASRYPIHRPVAVALGAAVALNLLRLGARAAGAPLVLDRALYLAFPALSLALAAEVLVLRWSRWAPVARGAVAALWLAGVVAVAVEAPPRGSPELQTFMGAAQLAVVVGELLLVAAFVARRQIPDITQTVVLLLVAGDVAERAGAWLYGHPGRDWDLARWQWAVVYLVIWYGQDRRSKAWTIRAADGAPGSSRSGRRSR